MREAVASLQYSLTEEYWPQLEPLFPLQVAKERNFARNELS